MDKMREDARYIVDRAIETVLPERAVAKALEGLGLRGKIFMLAIGKAAWRMASSARERLGETLKTGVVITKYGHSFGDIPGIEVFEAGHPLPDENTLKATARALEMLQGEEYDSVLFLVSGGGSSLFELPAEGVTLKELKDINNQLLRSGASITEINTIRKRLSKVKGGRLTRMVAPAQVYSLVLSDVLGDRLDSIASGPAYPDSSTVNEALSIVEKYSLNLSPAMIDAIKGETPNKLLNVQTEIVGSVGKVCEAAGVFAGELGYEPLILTTTLDCEAREAGKLLSAIAREEKHDRPVRRPCAIILGGETVVLVKGEGKGGRNQELALSFAISAQGLTNTVLVSVGTDGTDGPTDAAGAIVDGQSRARMIDAGIDPDLYLIDNDSYNALKSSGDLLLTGPTGTNVNDLIVLLCR
jgi:hydroxypyruvate reductase